MNILSLTLGAQTGWAYVHDGKITSGTKAFKPNAYSAVKLRHLRMQTFFGDFPSLHAVYIHDGEQGQMIEVLQKWCRQRGIALQRVPTANVAAYWIGVPTYSREQMMEKAIQRGFTPGSGHEAAALGLLAFATMANRSQP